MSVLTGVWGLTLCNHRLSLGWVYCADPLLQQKQPDTSQKQAIYSPVFKLID